MIGVPLRCRRAPSRNRLLPEAQLVTVEVVVLESVKQHLPDLSNAGYPVQLRHRPPQRKVVNDERFLFEGPACHAPEFEELRIAKMLHA